MATGQSARRCRPIPLRQQPWVSLGSSPCHARPNSRWITIARTRQVTVMKIICGVDISKASLDACIEPGGIRGSFDNDAAGIAALAAFCRQHQAELVVMEASGGYERRAFLLLWEQGMPCAVTNPRNVRRYAEAMGVSGEDGSDRCQHHRSLRTSQGSAANAAAEPGAAAPEGPCGKAPAGHRRSHRAEAAPLQPARQCRDAGQPRRGDRPAQAPVPHARRRDRLDDRRRSVVGPARTKPGAR